MRAANAICFISPLTFGIYLIHDSPEMRSFMYENIFHSSEMYDLPASFLIFLAFAAATFVACAIAELLRRETTRSIVRIVKHLKTRIEARKIPPSPAG